MAVLDVTAKERQTGRRGTVRLTTSQALLRFLTVQYSVRDGERRRLIPGLYGIFGHGNTGGIGQALSALPPGELFFLEGRHEQSMVHAAAAFAKASRRTATLACTSSIGPGALNMLVGAAGAHLNRLPVLLLPADTFASRFQGPILQGLEYPLGTDVSVNDCYRPVSRFFDRIVRPEQLLTALPAAMRVLTSPEDAGPAVVALPQDTQAEAYDYPEEFFDEREWLIDRPVPDPTRVAQAAEVVRGAERPVIIAGGGVRYSDADEELRGFANALGIPVTETCAGKGVFAEGSWLDLGGLGVEGTACANAVVAAADVVIAVGTRLQDFMTGSRTLFRPDARFVGINVTRLDAYKEHAAPVVGDARVALHALREAVGTYSTEQAYRHEVEELVDEWRRSAREFVTWDGRRQMSQADVIAVVNEEVRPEATITAAAGTGIMEILKFWDCSGGRLCHLEFGFSCMSYEIPAAIGVRLARPDAEAYAFVGDGTFLLNPGELVTAVQNGIKITVLVSANGTMESICRIERAVSTAPFANVFSRRNPVTREQATEPLGLDLAKVAEGLGAKAWTATTPDELRAALRASREEPGPSVIVAVNDPGRYLARGGVWWDIPPAEVSADDALAAARSEYATRAARRRPLI
ncbi:MAG: 3D-(3,5/4)-trihydroxycyclohexane-1,2-dione acylhydrolase (decyclizing) [Gaiellaceae bacterium]|jgi:3D-(3,5/4)-trihydroxycyclohexane-1,2-dione acylhydrolase (decyclizing)